MLYKMKLAKLEKNQDYPERNIYSRVKSFKTYTLPTKYGERLCGFRAYNEDDECVLSAGWFDPAFLIDKKFQLTDNEVIAGFKSLRHKDFEAVHYDVRFIIRQVNQKDIDLSAPNPNKKNVQNM